jgi:hypothetical protein
VQEERQPDRDPERAQTSSGSWKSSSHNAGADRAQLGVTRAQRPARLHTHRSAAGELQQVPVSPGTVTRQRSQRSSTTGRAIRRRAATLICRRSGRRPRQRDAGHGALDLQPGEIRRRLLQRLLDRLLERRR